MANYIQKIINWIGHSVNDTPPSAAGKLGNHRLDTDTGRPYYSDNTDWKDFNASATYTPIALKTANATLTDSEANILVDATSGSITITLPPAANRTGKRYLIKRIDPAGTTLVTIDANASETIDGLLTWELRQQGGFVEIVALSGNWVVLTSTPFDISAYKRNSTATGRWYVAANIANAALSNLAITANVLYANPIVIPKTSTINDIAVNVITGVAATGIKLGLYNDSGNLSPSSLLFDSGELSTATSGTFQTANISPAKKLQPGLYWLACISNGTPSIKFVPLTNQYPFFSFDNVSASNTAASALYKGLTYPAGALPDPYPTSPSFNVGAQIPAIFARFL